MKIISWNVNGIRACAKKGLFKYIEKESPDIVCLQEAKAAFADCGEIETSILPWQNYWHSAVRKGYSGVVNLHRQKPQDIIYGIKMPRFDDEGRVLITDQGDFYLFNMYFPNGGSGEERHLFKMDFLEKIVPVFKSYEKKKPLVLTGDFNIAHKEIDIHDPVRLDGTSGFMPEEREWMDRFVSKGFVDAYRAHYPNARDQYSWWSYRQGSRHRNKGWRIDYFFVSESLVPRVKEIRMDQSIEGSDHCPLVLTLK